MPIKLKSLGKQIVALARDHVGGFGMKLELGVFQSTLDADADRDTRSHNLDVFQNCDDTDLWDTVSDWRNLEIGPDATLDFYVYNRIELLDNLGILVRGGKIVGFHTASDCGVWRKLGEAAA